MCIKQNHLRRNRAVIIIPRNVKNNVKPVLYRKIIIQARSFSPEQRREFIFSAVKHNFKVLALCLPENYGVGNGKVFGDKAELRIFLAERFEFVNQREQFRRDVIGRKLRVYVKAVVFFVQRNFRKHRLYFLNESIQFSGVKTESRRRIVSAVVQEKIRAETVKKISCNQIAAASHRAYGNSFVF